MNHQKTVNRLARLLAVAAVVVFTAYGCSSSEEAEGTAKQPVAVNVQTAGLNQALATHRYSATVSSDHTVNLSTKVMGRITQLSVEVGDYVPKGEVLVRIKDDNLQAQKNQVEAGLSEARASLQNAEKNYERFKVLHEEESATQKELDDITTQYEVTKAKVKSLEGRLKEVNDMLDYTVLEAPFNGYVTAKNSSEGDMAGPGQPILSFEQKGALKIEVTVPETQIDLFKEGDTVSVDVGAADLHNLAGRVSKVSTSGNRGSRQFRVEIRLPRLDKDSAVRSGMFARVGLKSTAGSVVTVPKSAIIERGQLTGLYTLSSDSLLVLRWVRLGEQNGETVEVLSGLSAGEAFVTSIDGTLREGQKVHPQYISTATANE